MKQFIKNFNNLVQKTILKVKNKTILKVKNKTNNKYKITNFNKYIITFISLLFIYLFYLSIPILYDNTWLQRNIENQLQKNFKINFSISSDISYRILPTPHFLIKDSKIFKEDGDKTISLADIKNLKVFVSQKNFFKKEKIALKSIKINNANFSLSRNDLKLLNNSAANKFSNKKIEVNKSNIFFKNNSDEAINIIKISKAFIFLDEENLLNLISSKGEVFNIPFNFDYKKEFDDSLNREIKISAKKLKLNIYDNYNYKNKINSAMNGENILSFFNTSIKTDYKIEDRLILFNSSTSAIDKNKLNYNGELSINPFDLNLNINMPNYKLFKKLNIDSILGELIKSRLIFNENISIKTTINATTKLKKNFFQNIKIKFNVINGEINLNKTKFINDKILSMELERSNLFFENDNLILNTNVLIDIKNYDKLFTLLQTNRKFRKPIKKIVLNLDYSFFSNEITFNNFKINNKEASDELYRTIEDFSDNNFYNWNKNKRLMNRLIERYEG